MLLFYRHNSENGSKEGAAGVKAIYLSDGEALEHFKDIYDNFGEETKDDRIVAFVKAAFTEGSKQMVAIREERHHFKIVRNSAAGRLFYFWNPLLRIAFTAHHQPIRNWSGLQPRLIHAEVRRYFLAYAVFYHCVAPIIEAAFDIEEEIGQQVSSIRVIDHSENAHPRDENRYLAFLGKGQTFLESCLATSTGMNSGAFDTAFLGSVIDAAFSAQIADLGTTGAPDYDKQAIPSSLIRLAATHRPFWPVLITPSSWSVFAMAAIKNWKPAVQYFSPIVQGGRGATDAMEVHSLPGLWSPRGVIDPAGFTIGRRSLGSQEKHFRDPKDKITSDLLWYVLRKSAELPFLYKQGWPELAVTKYHDETWPFLLRGKQHGLPPDVTNVYDDEVLPRALLDLDRLLIERFFNGNAAERIGDSELAIRVFQEARDELYNYKDLNAEVFGAAINVQYLQV